MPARWRILVIDELPLVRRGLSDLIESEPDLAVFAQAGTGVAALEALSVHQPDLVTLEIVLKGSDGLELLKDIRSRFPNLPVLVISANDESVYAERVFRAGARGYVTKHERDETVLVAIRRVLEGGNYVSPRMTVWFVQQYLDSHQQKPGSQLASLSDRELQIFRLLGEHKTRGEIGRMLGVSVKTVESHRAKIKEKLGLHSGAELNLRATQWVTVGGDN